MKIKNVAALTSVLGLVLGLTAACGEDESSSGADGLTKVSIVYAAPVADQQIPAVTKEAGIFEKYGIDADVKYLQLSQATPAVAGGQAQLGVFAAPSPQTAAVTGTGFKYVAQWQNVANLLLMARPGIKSVKDLDGKSIGVTSSGGTTDVLAQNVIKENGISAKRAPLGTLQNDLNALIAGRVDATILGPDAQAAVEEKLPGTTILHDFSKDADSWVLGLVGLDSWLKANKETVVKVLKALNEGIEYFKTHPAEAQAVIKANAGLSTDEAAEQAYESTVSLLTSSIVPTVEPQQKILEMLSADQPEAKDFNAADLIDDSYAKEAVGS